MNKKSFRPNRMIILVLIFMAAQLACSLSSSKKSDATSTPGSLPTPTMLPTRTPRSTLTPLPLATNPPPPTDTPMLPNAAPTPDLTAIAESQATQPPSISPEIEADLQKYGFSTSQGYLGWSQDQPVPLKLETYREKKFEMVADGQNFTDFVFQAKVTWQSAYGWIVCGLVFRSEPNLERGAQYVFQIGRGAPWLGKNYWDIEYNNNGNWVSTVTNNVYNSESIDDANGASNILSIVVQGNQFTPYINFQEHKIASDSNQPEGVVAFYAWQESGKTTCTFEDAWVWVLE